MRIHTDKNNVYVNAISMDGEGYSIGGHLYQITAGNKTTELMFQHGGVVENGVNGITNESLLAVLANRIEFLNSKFPCEENITALENITLAQAALESRTAKLMLRAWK